jgi:hypothetical protein
LDLTFASAPAPDRVANVKSTPLAPEADIVTQIKSRRSRYAVLGSYIEGILQCCFKHGRGNGDHGRDENQEKTYGNPTRNVIPTAHNNKEVGFCR